MDPLTLGIFGAFLSLLACTSGVGRSDTANLTLPHPPTHEVPVIDAQSRRRIRGAIGMRSIQILGTYGPHITSGPVYERLLDTPRVSIVDRRFLRQYSTMMNSAFIESLPSVPGIPIRPTEFLQSWDRYNTRHSMWYFNNFNDFIVRNRDVLEQFLGVSRLVQEVGPVAAEDVFRDPHTTPYEHAVAQNACNQSSTELTTRLRLRDKRLTRTRPARQRELEEIFGDVEAAQEGPSASSEAPSPGPTPIPQDKRDLDALVAEIEATETPSSASSSKRSGGKTGRR